MIATNCEQLELYVAGQYLTTATPDTTDFASLAYPPALVDLTVDGSTLPDLRIDGYVSNQLVTSLYMSSDTTKDQLVLTIDDSAIDGDGSDATRFTIRALDAYGNQRPYPSGEVTLTLTGPATLIADNPFPFAVYGGVGGGFIQSEVGGSGTVSLTAAHPTLGQDSRQLTVTATTVATPGPGSPPPGSPAQPTPTPPQPTPPSTTASPPATTTSPPATTGSAPAATPRATAAAIRAALAKLLRPRGAAARIRALREHSGYSTKFDAPAAGLLIVAWFHTSARGARELVAGAYAPLTKAGPATVKVELTPQGRRLLRHSAHERVTVEAEFTAVGGPTVRSSAKIDLTL
jgi:hypothetical protein